MRGGDRPRSWPLLNNVQMQGGARSLFRNPHSAIRNRAVALFRSLLRLAQPRQPLRVPAQACIEGHPVKHHAPADLDGRDAVLEAPAAAGEGTRGDPKIRRGLPQLRARCGGRWLSGQDFVLRSGTPALAGIGLSSSLAPLKTGAEPAPEKSFKFVESSNFCRPKIGMVPVRVVFDPPPDLSPVGRRRGPCGDFRGSRP